MKDFDVFVIGTGTAGETAVSELLKKGDGLRIGIADERPYGGTCALRGCQPKKFLLVPAHAALEGRALTERGFRSAPQLDWKAMNRSLREFTDPVPQNARTGLEEKGVACFSGHCEFQSPGTLRCGDQSISAENFIVATGARPRTLPVKGADLAVSSDGFLDKETETVLGAHLVGPHAGELINLFALAMKHRIPVKDLQELPWAYPTYSADIKYMLG